jgi:hypothetical protein
LQGPEPLAIPALISDRKHSVADRGKNRSKRWTLETGTRRAEQIDDLALHNADETRVRTAPRGELCDSANLSHLASAGSRALITPTRACHELADNEANDEQHDGRLNVITTVDGQRVVRAGEEEVETQCGDDRRERATPPAARKGSHGNGKHEKERGVGREHSPAKRDQDP